MLEIIRVLIKTKKQIKAPLIFIFNGAEELGMLGAHAFIAQHPWASR
jgi:Zn-dependent M28 family amino/carboxypeptidase